MVYHRQYLLILAILLPALLAACSPSAADNPIPVTGATLAATLPPTVPANLAAERAMPTTASTQMATSAAQPTMASTGPAAAQCQSPAALTPAVTEGPYFKANSPQRADLLDAGITGTKLVLSGYVLTADCQPVANAMLDFWQANAQGQYDNSGYTLRGHQFTDAGGHYQLTTIIPGLYPGRTEHIHVKVQAPGGPILTTQMFFPGVQQNDSDSIYDSQLLVSLQDAGDGKAADFNFVISLK